MILSPIFLDIETTGLQPFEVKDGEIIEHRIVAIGIGKLYFKEVLIDDDEKKTLLEFLSFLREHKGIAVLVGYNITNFDIPFITARALKHGLYDEIAIIREVYRIDLMTLVQRYLLTGNQRYVKLKHICQFLGIKVEDDISGAEVPKLWEEGNVEAIYKHCLSDLKITEQLFWKLEKLAAHNLKVRYSIQEEVEFGYP